MIGVLGACTTAPAPPPDRAGSLPPSASAAPTSPALASTGGRAERVAALPVGVRTTREGKRVVYSEPLQVREGQLILAVAEFQTTNDLELNVFVGSQIVLADSATTTAGRAVTAANGENVTPEMHHGQQTKSGTLRATAADTGPRFVNLVVWAAASRAAPHDVLNVDPGYGRLSVLSW